MPILTSVESDENKGLLRLLKTKKLENYYSKEVQNTKPEYVLDDTYYILEIICIPAFFCNKIYWM